MDEIVGNSGKITLSVSSTNYITGHIEWSESDASIKDGTSVVTASLVYVHSGNFDTYSNESDFYLTINGDTKRHTSGWTMTPGKTYTVLTHSVTVPHDPDGKKTITISGGGGLEGTTGLASSSGSATVELATINRPVSFNLDGVWKYVLMWLNVDGVWRRVIIPWIRVVGAWLSSAGEIIVPNDILSIEDDGNGNVSIVFADTATVEYDNDGNVNIVANCFEQDEYGNVAISEEE